MRRSWLWVFLFFVAADLAVGGWLVYAFRSDPWWVIEARKALFTDYMRERSVFETEPEALEEIGFRLDAPADVEAEAQWIHAELPYMQGVPPGAPDGPTAEKAKALAMLYSKNGGGGCMRSAGHSERLRRIAEGDGRGCCSDHAEVFVTLGRATGLMVRETGNSVHTFNEVWLPDRGKWAFIDTHYAVMAKGPDGEYLSLLEMRDLYLAGRKDEVQFDFFGNEHHVFSREDPHGHEIYDGRDDFTDVWVTWGTNVLEQDRFEHRLRVLPKGTRQLLGFMLGVFPKAALFEDADSEQAGKRRRDRALYLSLAAALGAGTIGSALFVMLPRRRPGRS